VVLSEAIFQSPAVHAQCSGGGAIGRDFRKTRETAPPLEVSADNAAADDDNLFNGSHGRAK
jgi:hypothetical protein